MSWAAIALVELQGRGCLWIVPRWFASEIDTTGLTLPVVVHGQEPRALGLVEGDLDLLLTVGDSLQARAASIAIEGRFSFDTMGRGWVWVIRQFGVPQTVKLRSEDLAITGRLAEIEVTEASLTASIVDDPEDDRGLLLEPGASVSDLTWPRTDAQRAEDGDPSFVGTASSASNIQGAPYPVIIGAPGRNASLTGFGALVTVDLPCAPALLVETSDYVTHGTDHRILLCGGRISATTIRRFGVDQNGEANAEDHTVETGHDKQGRLVSYVSPGSGLDVPTEDSEGWWALSDGYGMSNPYAPGPLRRADHVLRWALERSTLTIDRRSWPRLSALSRFKLDISVYSQVGAWEWARSQILPLLPVRVVNGPAGLFFHADVPPSNTSRAPVTLTVGNGCTMLGGIRRIPAEPITHLVARYCPDARTGRGARQIQVGPARGRPGTSAVETLPSFWAKLAATEIGYRPAELEIPITSDKATATAIALAYVERRSRPAFEFDLAVGAAAWQSLSTGSPLPGDEILVEDSRHDLSQVAVVRSVRYSGGSFTIGARIWARTGRE